MRRAAVLIGIGAALFGFVQWRASSRAVWTKIATGVELRTLQVGAAHSVRVVALRTAPGRVHVTTGGPFSAPEWRQHEAALMAVNGGFFDASGRSLGLRVSHGRRVSRTHSTKWGVFLVRDGTAHIIPSTDFKMQDGIRDAVQCGPRLVVDGHITDLKPQWARRTGIGIQRTGRVIVAVADGQLSFQEWAALWASRDGLNCPNALNLDGGSSTQLSLKTRTTSLEIPAGRLVPDAVVVR